MSFLSVNQRTDSFGPLTRSHTRTMEDTDVFESRHARNDTSAVRDDFNAHRTTRDHHNNTDQSHSSVRELPRYDRSPLRPSRYHENHAPAHREPTVSTSQYGRILRNASRNDLLEHGNHAYMQVSDAYMRVKAERDAIKKLNEELTASIGNLLHDNTIPSSRTAAVVLNMESTPRESDYPNIVYWKRKTYNAILDAKKMDKGVLTKAQRRKEKLEPEDDDESTSMDYIETIDGKSINNSIAQSIRALLRSLFTELKTAADTGGPPMPASWGGSTESMHDHVLSRLYAKYPFIRYCEADWKAKYLLSRVYSTWKNTRLVAKKKNSEAKLKREPKTERTGDDDDDDDDGPSPSKKICLDEAASPPSDDLITPLRTPTPSIPPSTYLTPQPQSASNFTDPTPIAIPKGRKGYGRRKAPTVPSPTNTTHNLTSSTGRKTRAQAVTKERAAPVRKSQGSTPHHPVAANEERTPTGVQDEPEDRSPGAATSISQAVASSCVETNVSKTIPVPATASNKPAPLVNPLDALFGPPSAPSTRRDALTADKASVPPRASPLKTATKDGAPEKVKEITASASAKNLCYIAYLETHERISSAAFNDYYKNLPKDEIKAWNSKSKLAKLKAA